MIRATPVTSIEGAESYFNNSLTQGDYYLGTETNGNWHGKATEVLGFEAGSPVTKEQFQALLRGLHPVTGAKLAQRIRKDRRPGVDLTFSVPKSISLVWAINQDERLVEAIREAVSETMAEEIEPLMCRRVRDGAKAASKDRKPTRNFVYADFLHKTSRPVEGVVDPHLHVHAFVMNYTHDSGKHYAAEMEEIFRQRPYLQAAFEARLARKLQHDLGYSVEKVKFHQSGFEKHGWEIQGIDRSTIEKFSSRTAQVEAFAEKHGIQDAALKGKLGAKIRDKKIPGSTVEELRQQWDARLTSREKAAFKALKVGAIGSEGRGSEALKVSEAVRYALEHHLYRQSTVEKHVVVGTALEHGLTLLPRQIEAALETGDVIHRTQDVRGADRNYITTQEVLEAERRMVEFAREGRGTRYAIARQEHTFERDWLNEEQKSAVHHILNSRDTVTAVTGGAGTGKSSLMQEAAEAIRANGKKLYVFAPSTGAREVLEEKGFQAAQTVEHLIRNEQLQAELKDQVLWVDEAGLMDVRSMNAVFDIAKAQNARIVLSGDSRQHASPRRGEALRIIEQEAGLDIARIDTIQRQKGRYKKAVELVSLGNTVIDARSGLTGMLAGFDLLDRLGKIQEIPSEKRHEVLAKQYLESATEKTAPLIVAPSHVEGEAVTDVIRGELRERGAIGKKSREIGQLRALNLSTAQKGQAATFKQDGTVVQFFQNVKGNYKRGERYRVSRSPDGEVGLKPLGGGRLRPIPLEAADRFEVFAESRLELAVGDKVRFTLGGKESDGKRQISNGRIDEVTGFGRNGDLKLKSGLRISGNYGHLDYGYVVTSHASQGKDSPLAMAAIGSQSLPAVNAKQFYVTVSRGRDDVAIYVDDKTAVRSAIQNAGEQLSATELVQGHSEQATGVGQSQHHRRFYQRVRSWWQAQAPRQGLDMSQEKPRNYSGFQPAPELGR